MKDITGSADRAANYPAFPTTPNDGTPPPDPQDAALPPARPVSAPPSTPVGAGMVRGSGRVIDLRLILVILLLGGPLLAFCILAGR